MAHRNLVPRHGMTARRPRRRGLVLAMPPRRSVSILFCRRALFCRDTVLRRTLMRTGMAIGRTARLQRWRRRRMHHHRLRRRQWRRDRGGRCRFVRGQRRPRRHQQRNNYAKDRGKAAPVAHARPPIAKLATAGCEEHRSMATRQPIIRAVLQRRPPGGVNPRHQSTGSTRGVNRYAHGAFEPRSPPRV